MSTNQIELTGVFVKDLSNNGYSAFFAELPNIIAGGSTQEEATKNLFETIKAAFNHERNQLLVNTLQTSEVTTKSFNLAIE